MILELRQPDGRVVAQWHDAWQPDTDEMLRVYGSPLELYVDDEFRVTLHRRQEMHWVVDQSLERAVDLVKHDTRVVRGPEVPDA